MRKVIRKIVKAIMLLLSRIEIEGKENIQSGNVVYVCNHQTIFDAVIPFAFLPENTYFMAKKELFKFKPLAALFMYVGVFPVDRAKADLKSIKYACNVLKENNNLVIFPQGTRTGKREIERKEMHAGTGLIALKQKSTVIPMMFLNKPGLFRKNKLVIGKPMDVSKFDNVKLNSDNLALFTDELLIVMNMLLEKRWIL